MISTIASAEEVYRNQIGPYSHQDEWWLWVPSLQQGYNHLNGFCAAIQTTLQGIKEGMWLELLGSPSEDFTKIFVRQFPWLPIKTGAISIEPAMAVLHFEAGKLNSRKSMVTPYLPHLSYTREE